MSSVCLLSAFKRKVWERLEDDDSKAESNYHVIKSDFKGHVMLWILLTDYWYCKYECVMSLNLLNCT